VARTDPRNTTRYWHDRRVPGLSLLCADFTTQEYPPHTHDEFVIAVTEAGGAVIKSRGQVELADTASLFVLNPAEAQSSRMGTSRHWRYRAFYLAPAAIDAIAAGIGIASLPYVTCNRLADPELIVSFGALHRALADGGDALHEQELLIDTFGALSRRHLARHQDGRRLRREPALADRSLLETARALIHGRLGEPILLEDLSAALGLTQYQIIRLFKRTTGLTPHSYVTQTRLEAARRLLAQGTPIGETAVAAGFYDQSALTKHFKRWYGVTPLQFARAARV
jgi:AraC-like DNA-binding protein